MDHLLRLDLDGWPRLRYTRAPAFLTERYSAWNETRSLCSMSPPLLPAHGLPSCLPDPQNGTTRDPENNAFRWP